MNEPSFESSLPHIDNAGINISKMSESESAPKDRDENLFNIKDDEEEVIDTSARKPQFGRGGGRGAPERGPP